MPSLNRRQARSESIKRHLHTQIRQFHLLDGLGRRSPSPKAVHELRVCIRKIRSMIWLLKQDQKLSTPSSLLRDLRALGHTLGRIREIDVAKLVRKQHGIGLRSYRWKRRHAERSLLHRHDDIFHARLLSALDRLDARVTRIPMIDTGKSAGKLREIASGWGRFDKLKDRGLHKLRVEIKRVRYAVAALERDDRSLKALQAMLGQIHDLELIPKKRRNKRIRRKAERIRKEFGRSAPRYLRSAINHLERV